MGGHVFTDAEVERLRAQSQVNRIKPSKPVVLADELGYAADAVNDAQASLATAWQTLRLLQTGPNPLPAPVLTEDTIVAALKADPGMAGRVMARTAWEYTLSDRSAMSLSAAEYISPHGVSTTRGATALQSLAVALAAASYRG